MKKRSVILLIKDGNYEFYGSPISLYEKHTSEELGISNKALNNYFQKCEIENDCKVYENKLCTIVKGAIYSKPSTRGRKKQND